ncbi:tetratricopeptide repeat protein [Pseudoduganella chitinolytica]|uniref:Tetratricopeptide repeat protein n=1 Tax=Pseudoduganella chitinolytica TaxID=34070 RepID=A0ABY8B6F7_9BURK|nr:tetratricopeptide repeat protein [Pseudoduganella chitinolytica]WEF31316.1 tetratricopeptide repeat protein [Pseudoduganella chitinolytica]
MRRLVLVFLAVLLSACADLRRAQAPAHLFDDSLFRAPRQVLDAAAIHAPSPAMQAYAAEVRRNRHGNEARQALVDALYRRDDLKLDYDAAVTRTAAEAFAARHGNCLSLVIMTAALAEEAGIPVVFQSVPTADAWTRTGSLYFNVGHVNLLLRRKSGDTVPLYDPEVWQLVDFMPPDAASLRRAERIDRATVTAMFMNNRAAEALARGDVDDAYWWTRNAIGAAPGLLHAYNTLAIVYQRHGNHALAEAALRHALDREPDNTMMLSNLVQLLQAAGRPGDAAPVQARLALLQAAQPVPFHDFDLGRQAMAAGDYVRARRLFERELRRDPHHAEFHFWLAQAAAQLGDLRAADEHLRRALAGSTTSTDRDLYSAKLERLRAATRTR